MRQLKYLFWYIPSIRFLDPPLGPPLLSILYMGLTGSVLTYPNLWPQRSAS